MDHFSLIGRWRALALIAAMLAACGERDPIFSNLALAIGGLDFPHTREQLALCRKTDDESCLKTYRAVKTARKSLFSRPRQQARQMTFDTIRETCPKPQADLPTESTCMGAVIALYFFSRPEDDLSIREFFDKLPPFVLEKVLSSGGAWLSNRENKPGWKEWVSKSPLSEESRKTFLIQLDMQPEPESTINYLDNPE